jgi:hypothetical protein
MKSLKLIAVSILLSLLCTLPAIAGDIEIPGYTQPPPTHTQPAGDGQAASCVLIELIAHSLLILT